MTKGRTTTYDERIKIVQCCIEHENNYAETAEKYQVSYQQVYTWFKKYQANGVEGLLDRRGRTKPEAEMSELEKLRAENRLLKAENRRKEMEMAFLKKLDKYRTKQSIWQFKKYTMKKDALFQNYANLLKYHVPLIINGCIEKKAKMSSLINYFFR